MKMLPPLLGVLHQQLLCSSMFAGEEHLQRRKWFEAKNKLYKNFKIRTKKIMWKSRHKKMRYKGAPSTAQGTTFDKLPGQPGQAGKLPPDPMKNCL
jgi:hypothetical protein